jgi:sugar lactone lactonase YvrE
MKASVLYPSHCILGEGPLWHPERKTVFWVDIENRKLYGYNWETKITRSWTFDYKVSMVVIGKDGYLILALQGGIARFHPDSEAFEWITDLEKEIPDNRSNDGKCDIEGRLWVGTMHKDHKQGAGSLYCIEGHRQVYKRKEDVSISNGLAWSLDNARLYYIDSPTQTVQSFYYNQQTGDIEFEKVIITIPPEMGTPDGMTMDSEGMLWIAHWGGFGVYRWNPHTGNLIGKISVPAPNITSCTFAGDQLDYLVITTASENLSAEELLKYPESGNVFIVTPGVHGTLSYECKF